MTPINAFRQGAKLSFVMVSPRVNITILCHTMRVAVFFTFATRNLHHFDARNLEIDLSGLLNLILNRVKAKLLKLIVAPSP
jgi:hypothetical protein